jgi:hypothetical protein
MPTVRTAMTPTTVAFPSNSEIEKIKKSLETLTTKMDRLVRLIEGSSIGNIQKSIASASDSEEETIEEPVTTKKPSKKSEAAPTKKVAAKKAAKKEVAKEPAKKAAKAKK